MTRDELAQYFVPLPIRWRHVRPGDVIVGKEAQLWQVRQAPHGTTTQVEITADGTMTWRGSVDPDEVAQVLVPVPMAEAMVLTRDELGARLIERRTEMAA